MWVQFRSAAGHRCALLEGRAPSTSTYHPIGRDSLSVVFLPLANSDEERDDHDHLDEEEGEVAVLQQVYARAHGEGGHQHIQQVHGSDEQRIAKGEIKHKNRYDKVHGR